MPEATDPYKKIHNILNMFGLKVPKSRKFTKLLKLLYTPEEAELLGHFGTPYMHMEPIKRTVEITGRNKEDIEALFDNMVKKGT
ncbi:MAG: hypothetical protein ACOZBW_00465, partial [Thermodesulfobacteriota bacterium]